MSNGVLVPECLCSVNRSLNSEFYTVNTVIKGSEKNSPKEKYQCLGDCVYQMYENLFS